MVFPMGNRAGHNHSSGWGFSSFRQKSSGGGSSCMADQSDTRSDRYGMILSGMPAQHASNPDYSPRNTPATRKAKAQYRLGQISEGAGKDTLFLCLGFRPCV